MFVCKILDIEFYFGVLKALLNNEPVDLFFNFVRQQTAHLQTLQTSPIMINQIKKFKKNAIALELLGVFTEDDALLIEQLFEEKLKEGYQHVNILIKVKDMSAIKEMKLKGFFEGELWGIKHFGKIGRCAVVSHSGFMKSVVNLENKILHLFNPALEERYFDETALDEALKFIAPDE
ncbi:STAS/SEC14 domain-containing protein [Empedobacter brevis]|uniref:STAS/SEC14 domain-containing protein n=1 Tax=Empedobacter brevis TaxID=247 RepID=UPI00289A5A92|nr:STAS/SEC14 domain-containing protein [Empedobacter brevis]